MNLTQDFNINPSDKHFPEADAWMWNYCTFLGKFTDDDGNNYDLGIYLKGINGPSAAIVDGNEAGSYFSGEILGPNKGTRPCYKETIRRAQILRLIPIEGMEPEILKKELKEQFAHISLGTTLLSNYKGNDFGDVCDLFVLKGTEPMMERITLMRDFYSDNEEIQNATFQITMSLTMAMLSFASIQTSLTLGSREITQEKFDEKYDIMKTDVAKIKENLDICYNELSQYENSKSNK